MVTEKEIIEKLTVSVSENVAVVIQQTLSEIVQKEVSKALAHALFEGKFQRGMNSEVFNGIESIFFEISSFKKNLKSSSGSSSALLDCSTSVLDDIIGSTEKATLNILDCLDQMQLLIQTAKDSSQNGGSNAIPQLEGIESVISTILTELSFQDLTGQQIRMVIKSLKRVEELVYEVYLMAKALHKTKVKSPDKDIEELKEEAKDLVSAFKKKGEVIDQKGVDALFEEIGF